MATCAGGLYGAPDWSKSVPDTGSYTGIYGLTGLRDPGRCPALYITLLIWYSKSAWEGPVNVTWRLLRGMVDDSGRHRSRKACYSWKQTEGVLAMKLGVLMLFFAIAFTIFVLLPITTID